MDLYADAGRGFNQLAVGDDFETTMTLTETHIVLGAGLFGDFNPLHVNQTYAEQTRFGSRIAHGFVTSNMMAAPMGMLFHSTAIAYVEHNVRFTNPVRAGDTLTVKWTVTMLDVKPKVNGGLVTLSGTCVNHEGKEVASAEAKLLVRDKP